MGEMMEILVLIYIYFKRIAFEVRRSKLLFRIYSVTVFSILTLFLVPCNTVSTAMTVFTEFLQLHKRTPCHRLLIIFIYSY